MNMKVSHNADEPSGELRADTATEAHQADAATEAHQADAAMTHGDAAAIHAEGLWKSFGDVQAVRGVSLDVHRGELYGLIGPDGAGKTTTLHILTTLMLADKGTGRVGDWDIVKDYRAIRSGVGYMPGRFSLYQDLTIAENLHFFANLFGVDLQENMKIIEPVFKQLSRFMNRAAGHLSGGMKQKLALCCALIHKPSILFLDEPTVGVDVIARGEFWKVLRSLTQQGVTILVTTSYMDEATMCDRISLINRGQILQTGAPGQLIANFGSQLLAIAATHMMPLLRRARQLPYCQDCYTFGQTLHFVSRQPVTMDRIRGDLADIPGFTVQVAQPNIEDLFIKLMKN